MVLHYVPTTPEEEELALALAISASLSANKSGAAPRPAPGGSGSRSSSSSFTNGAARASAGSGATASKPPALSPLIAAGSGAAASSSAYPAVPAIGSPTRHGPGSPLARPAGLPVPQTSSPLLPQRPAAAPSYYPAVPPIHPHPQQPQTAHQPHPHPHQPPPPQQHYAGLRPGAIQPPGTAAGSSASGPSGAPPARRRWDLPPGAPNGPGLPGPSAPAGTAGAPPAQPRRRWDLGGVGGGSASSAPASPKGAAAAASGSGGSFSSRHGSPSRSAAAAAARQGYPGAGGPSASASSASHPQPGQQRPLPPIGRSKSATGPNGLMGAGCAAGGGGSASGGAAAVGGQRPALPPPPTLFSDPEACAGCGKGFGGVLGTVLGLAGGGYVTGMNRKWHPDCFKCGFCSEPISSGRGSFSYQMHPGDPRPYHPDCYKHVHHPVCTVCGTFIPADRDGRIAFKEAGFWRERYCHSHAESDIVRCCACSRLQKKGEEWAPLPDGRPLCLGCLGSVVLDTADAQPLYGELMEWYRNDMRLPHAGAKPPLLLVDGPTLNEHAAREGRDDSAGAPVFHVRGLCVATVYTSIPTIRRGNGGALQTIATALSESAAAALGGGSVRCDVKCILLLYGLPRLLTGSIMAHELMHAWLRQAGCVGLPLKVEEGLCQLMACLWLDRQHELLAGSPEEQRLASFFSYQIRTDTSEVYGEGFREAMEAFQSHGLTNVVRNVQLYGRFTPP